MFLDRWQLMEGDRFREVVAHGRVELYLTFFPLKMLIICPSKVLFFVLVH